ncbi:hypothetical protein Tco_0026148 [Tanacetum coccineum]
MEFNFEMRYTIEKLNQELTDENIIFCDAHLGSMDTMKNFDQYGFNVMDSNCCGYEDITIGLYVYHQEWLVEMLLIIYSGDQFHLTAAINEILADNVWSGVHTNMWYPMNMKEMIAHE